MAVSEGLLPLLPGDGPVQQVGVAAAVIFVLLYWRSLPFVYHLRFLFYVVLGKWRGRCALVRR